MGNRSLGFRLFVSAVAWSIVALAIAGYILVKLHEQSILRNFDRQLDVYSKVIIGSIADDLDESGSLKTPENLGEGRFELPISGWYWQVIGGDPAAILMSSRSLFGENQPLVSGDNRKFIDGIWRGSIIGPANKMLRVVDRRVSLSDTDTYRVVVSGNADEVAEDIQSFGTRVALTLAVFGIGLILTTLLQVRFGLRPLERMRQALFAIRSGKTESLEGTYPAEITPLVTEMNSLIEANREIVDRSRTHVGNLAHALKTPLSVIGNEAGNRDNEFADKITEQTDIMRRQITHHLERARAAASRRVIGAVTDILPVAERLVRVMQRIYQERDLEISLQCAAGIRFLGEQQDLEEMLGNLADNACKWAASTVKIIVEPDGSTLESGRLAVRIRVEDDGSGLSQSEAALALERGERLDETVVGSGLGLSIVNELAVLYGGALELHRSDMGGMQARLILPIL